MWRKEDAKFQTMTESPLGTAGFQPSSDSSNSLSGSPKAAASISQGIRVKGEVTGTEDLFVDGFVEGKLNLTSNCCLTVGPNGNVKADLNAREIIVRGKVEGKLSPGINCKSAAPARLPAKCKPTGWSSKTVPPFGAKWKQGSWK